MATIFGKIISGVLLAGSSVLSVLVPPVGIPLLGASAALATKTWGSSDEVANSGNVVASGNTQRVMGQVNAGVNMTMTALQRSDDYNKMINQGYSPNQAASASGLSTLTTAPNWLLYGGIAAAGFVLLKILKIIK